MRKITINSIEKNIGDTLEKHKEELKEEFGENWMNEKFELEIHFKNGKIVNLINKEHFNLEE